MKADTGRWLQRSDGHLGAARLCQENGYNEHCVFWCQQALEVLLKAILVEQTESGRPPRTHDLVALARRTGLDFSQDQRLFLRRLAEQYSPTRYGDDPVEYSNEDTGTYLSRTEELYSWLRQLLN